MTFSENVTGVDPSDFALSSTGTLLGGSVTGVSGSNNVYTVTANTGTGEGTIRLDLADDDTIVDGVGNKLGGVGAGNGDFTTGQLYVIDRSAPTVTVNQKAGQADPTNSLPILWTVTFSEDRYRLRCERSDPRGHVDGRHGQRHRKWRELRDLAEWHADERHDDASRSRRTALRTSPATTTAPRPAPTPP